MLFSFKITLAQSSFNDSIVKINYPFLKLEANKIQNDSIALKSYYASLNKLQKDSLKVVSILHIGDSHIQADFFSGKLRQNYQLKYGNAGRGLVVPYRLAKTNEPSSYRFNGSSNFKSKKIVSKKDSLKVGITGVTIEAQDSLSIINFKTFDQETLNYSFSKITILSQPSPNQMQVQLLDKDFCEIKNIEFENRNSTNISVIKLENSTNEFYLKCYNPDSVKKMLFKAQGFILENDSAGVLYHAVGVNGAEFRHYNDSPLFYEQLPLLNPSLIIISLGTNDAYMPKFDTLAFVNNIQSMMLSIKSQLPNANFLFTTPGDSYRKRKAKNINMKIARNVIINYCMQNGYAYWDFYEIMGGFGSINKWFLKGLTSKDKLHLTRKGYELQGDILFKALQDGLERYSAN
ncbi:MAG: GDSL-type esterase/lipase family protein [Bacteroidota bacterium]